MDRTGTDRMMTVEGEKTKIYGELILSEDGKKKIVKDEHGKSRKIAITTTRYRSNGHRSLSRRLVATV